MGENTLAKVIRVIGWCVLIGGIIGAFILGYAVPTVEYYSSGHIHEEYNWGLTVGVIVGSIIASVLFRAIAEIIRLLQLGVDRLTAAIGDQKSAGHTTGGSMIKDIESNLPKI